MKRPRLPRVRSDLGLGLAAAMDGVLALTLTILFARLLGVSGYGSFGALVAAFLILSLGGSALQVTVAREVSAKAMQLGCDVWGSARKWSRDLGVLTLLLAVVSVLLRNPLSDILGVDSDWGASLLLPAASMWLLLALQRGLLQGIGAYGALAVSIVSEPAGWLLFGSVFVLAGLGPAGAFLGAASGIAMNLVLVMFILARRSTPPSDPLLPAWSLASVAVDSKVPLVALALLAAVQNLDVIAVKHVVSVESASSYVAASVAAKAIIWIGIGAGLYLVPEAGAMGRSDRASRALLIRTLALVAVAGTAMVTVFASAGQTILGFVFGSDLGSAGSALPALGVAMTLFSFTYLSAQFCLALRRASFVWLLALATVLEPVLIQAAGPDLSDIAVALVGLQLILAVATLSFAMTLGQEGSRVYGRPNR